MSPAALFLSSFHSPPSSPPTTTTTTLVVVEKAKDEEEIVGGYKLGKTIGFGGFSVVRLATPYTNDKASQAEVVAIKLVTANKRRERDLERERTIWEGLSHQHILPLFSYLHDSEERVCFVTMYCPAGSLLDLINAHFNQALPTDLLQPLFTQLVSALVYLHVEAKIVHGDLKLENVLVDEAGGVRLADFGLARRVIPNHDDVFTSDDEEDDEEELEQPPLGIHRSQSTITPRSVQNPPSRHRNSTTSHFPSSPRRNKARYGPPGSLPYSAPEVLSPPDEKRNQKKKSKPNPSVDIWALGVILHLLTTGGKFPWHDAFEPRLVWRIVCGPYTLPPNISPQAERILLGCLERDVSKRWTITMVDEVAWGVGGAEPVVLAEEPYLEDHILEEELEEDLDLSRSRSLSRARRSLSRARLAPYSSRQSLSPSHSTHSYPHSYSGSRSPSNAPPGLSHSVQSIQSLVSCLASPRERSEIQGGEVERGRATKRRIGSPQIVGLPTMLNVDVGVGREVEGLPGGLGISTTLSPLPLDDEESLCAGSVERGRVRKPFTLGLELEGVLEDGPMLFSPSRRSRSSGAPAPPVAIIRSRSVEC